jgi:hypothetical protein
MTLAQLAKLTSDAFAAHERGEVTAIDLAATLRFASRQVGLGAELDVPEPVPAGGEDQGAEHKHGETYWSVVAQAYVCGHCDEPMANSAPDAPESASSFAPGPVFGALGDGTSVPRGSVY